MITALLEATRPIDHKPKNGIVVALSNCRRPGIDLVQISWTLRRRPSQALCDTFPRGLGNMMFLGALKTSDQASPRLLTATSETRRPSRTISGYPSGERSSLIAESGPDDEISWTTCKVKLRDTSIVGEVIVALWRLCSSER